MDEREKLILDIFGEWASSCHQEYNDRYENPAHQEHINELTENAKNAFLKRSKYEVFRNYETEYYEAVYQYLLYGLHLGERIYHMQRARIDEFNDKWHSADRIISQSKNMQDAIDSLIGDFDTSDLIHKTFYDYGNEVGELEFKDFKLFMTQKKTDEYEKRFGKKFIFEQAGRFHATDIFRQMTKPKGRPRKTSNLDTLRAFQFGKLVRKINRTLKDQGYHHAAVSEVCELTFGDKRQVDKHASKRDINWALSEYFQMKNSTVRVFLNSISRGKSTLMEDELRDFYGSH